MHVTAADAASGDADEDFVRRRRGRGEIGELEILVAREEKGFHRVGFQFSVVSCRASEFTIEWLAREMARMQFQIGNIGGTPPLF